jgi:hypothetical protein
MFDPFEKEYEAGCLEPDQIFTYTRAQAIADGVLVDLMQKGTVQVVREAGFKFPVAMTVEAFGECVGGLYGEKLPAGQDAEGRLWDVLMVLRAAIRKLPPGCDRVDFQVDVWDGCKSQTVKLWSHCGPGDHGEPVLTIMLEGQD